MVGTQDLFIPLAGGEVVSPWGGEVESRPSVSVTLARWAGGLGCPAEPAQVRTEDGARIEVYGPGRDGVELLAYFIEGLGHHWPGGRGQLKRRLAGPPSNRVHANQVIWDFFRRQRRR